MERNSSKKQALVQNDQLGHLSKNSILNQANVEELIQLETLLKEKLEQ